jgi:hypothetical protein
VDRPSTRKVLLIDSADNEADASDSRTPITNYLRNPNIRTDKNIRRTTFKYVLMSDEFYRRTVNDVLLKCLAPDDAILAVGTLNQGYPLLQYEGTMPVRRSLAAR